MTDAAEGGWTGHFQDGQTARRRRVTLRLAPTALLAIFEDREQLIWSYADLRIKQGQYDGEHVRVESARWRDAAFVIEDPAFLHALLAQAPHVVAGLHDPCRRRLRKHLTLVALLAVLVVGAILYRWGIPAAAAVASTHVPPAWEAGLGKLVQETLAPEQKQCRDSHRLPIIQSLLDRLTATLSNNPYTFHLYVVDEPIVNAMASPGGYVFIFRGLLEETRSAEELTGILAHELQHLVRRHSVRTFLEQTSSTVLIAALTGTSRGSSPMDRKRRTPLACFDTAAHMKVRQTQKGCGRCWPPALTLTVCFTCSSAGNSSARSQRGCGGTFRRTRLSMTASPY